MSRFLIGLSVLATVAVGITAAASAQEHGERLQQFRQRAQARQSLASDPNETKIVGPGTYRFNFVHEGLKREYLVYVPASIRSRAPAPMLLALHGGGGDMDFQADNYGIKQKADQAGFIAVFPNGYSRFPSGIFATWNAGGCCGKAVEQKVDDVGFLKTVIERVSRQASIDRSRVYATGMSNGGLMSYRLACEAPDMARCLRPNVAAWSSLRAACRSNWKSRSSAEFFIRSRWRSSSIMPSEGSNPIVSIRSNS